MGQTIVIWEIYGLVNMTRCDDIFTGAKSLNFDAFGNVKMKDKWKQILQSIEIQCAEGS